MDFVTSVLQILDTAFWFNLEPYANSALQIHRAPKIPVRSELALVSITASYLARSNWNCREILATDLKGHELFREGSRSPIRSASNLTDWRVSAGLERD